MDFLDLRDECARLVERGDAGAIQICYMSANGEVGSHCEGWLDANRSVRLREHHVFPLYSITKVFIAILVLRLLERNGVNLDQPITSYLPQAGFAGTATVKMVLSHTGGLPCYGYTQKYNDDVRQHPDEPWSAEQFLSCAVEQGLRCDPGSEFHYSNIGYMLLVHLIEQQYGINFSRAVQEEIVRPLQLKHTQVIESIHEGHVHARSPYLNDAAVNFHYSPGWVAHRLVASTSADCVSLLCALSEGRLLMTEAWQEMRKALPVHHEHSLFQKPAYGLGLMVDLGGKSDTRTIYGHTGGGPGYSAAVYQISNAAAHTATAAVLMSGENTKLAETFAVELLRSLVAS